MSKTQIITLLVLVAGLNAVACASPVADAPMPDGVGAVRQALTVSAGETCCYLSSQDEKCTAPGGLIVTTAENDDIADHAQGYCQTADATDWTYSTWNGCCIGDIFNNDGQLDCTQTVDAC